ncbi:hypothetical protein ACOSQ3_030752 [Xanthoceras sorbifolium]
MRYLKGTAGVGLFFNSFSSLHISAYADADWGPSLDDRRSTSGMCVYFGNNLISWSSRKQKVVAKSSTEAEYRAVSQAASEVLWLSSLFYELGITLPACPVIWCDNTSAASLAQNLIFHARTKHIEIDVHFILVGLLKI